MRRSTLAASDKKMKKHKKKGSKKSTTRNIKRPRGSEAVYVIFCFFFQLFVAGSWNVERWRRCFIDGVERLSSSHRSGRILSSHGRLLYRVSIAFCFVFFYVVGLSNWLPPPHQWRRVCVSHNKVNTSSHLNLFRKNPWKNQWPMRIDLVLVRATAGQVRLGSVRLG